MAEHPTPSALTLDVARRFETLGIPYFLSGGLAAIVYGILRTTVDVDIVADIYPHQAQAIAQAFTDPFYVDPEVVREEAARQGSFSIVHFASEIDVDVHIMKATPFNQERMRRRVARQLAPDSSQTAYLATPEDVVLSKLDWLRQTGGTSERQWRDVLGILKVRREHLDLDYMFRWAESLGVDDLLDRALVDVEQ